MDIIQRLRDRAFAFKAPDPLLDEAASEIERLRLTDAEREAVEWCRDNITAMAHPSSAFAHVHASSLRGYLARCARGSSAKFFCEKT